MAAFFGIEESNARGFIDKGIVCIPHRPDGQLDLHAVVSAIRNEDIVFIKHCTSDLSLHIKAAGLVMSDYPTESNLGTCLPVKWLWQGELVPVNVDEAEHLSNEPFYEEHNILVQKEIVDLLTESTAWLK